MMLEIMLAITEAGVPSTAIDAPRTTTDEERGATDFWILSIIALVVIAEVAFAWWLFAG